MFNKQKGANRLGINQLYDNNGFETDERKSDGVFGVPIDKEGDVPPILFKFIRYLNIKAPQTEYIFKITPPPGKEIQNLKRKIKLDKETVDINSHTQNPHVVAELMKQYLAMLPEPLLSYEFYDSFIMALTVKIHEDRLDIFKKLLSRLPKSYNASSRQVLALLASIATEFEKTKMNVDSLAKIFGGYFLKSPQNIYFRENDQTYVDEILCILITEHEYLFSNIVGAKPHPRPPSGPPKMRAPTMPRSPSIRYQTIKNNKTEGTPHLFILQQKKYKMTNQKSEISTDISTQTNNQSWVGAAKNRSKSNNDSKPLLKVHLSSDSSDHRNNSSDDVNQLSEIDLNNNINNNNNETIEEEINIVNNNVNNNEEKKEEEEIEMKEEKKEEKEEREGEEGGEEGEEGSDFISSREGDLEDIKHEIEISLTDNIDDSISEIENEQINDNEDEEIESEVTADEIIQLANQFKALTQNNDEEDQLNIGDDDDGNLINNGDNISNNNFANGSIFMDEKFQIGTTMSDISEISVNDKESLLNANISSTRITDEDIISEEFEMIET